MKQVIFTTIALILSSAYVNGQQFEFTVYFEDAIGNRDSVILGYDNTATYGIDSMFGEVDISKQPYNSIFEVRGAAYNYPLECNSLNNRDQLIFESKRLITFNTCEYSSPLESESAMITIKSKYTPVKVSWDSTLFHSTCIKSYLVDWQPGGWFDACCCNGINEDGLVLLNSTSFFIFSNTDFQFLTESDTIFTLFFPLSNDEIVGIEDLTEEENGIKIYPNPISGRGVLEFENKTNDLHSFTIYDNNGRMISYIKNTRARKFEFELNDCANGLYFYELTNKKTQIKYRGKFIYNKK